MSKILHIAWREFLSTVATKAFILGILMMPLLIGIMVVAMPILLNEDAPKLDGEFAVIDPTGLVLDAVEEYLSPEQMALRREETANKIDEAVPIVKSVRKLGGEAAEVAMDEALENAFGDLPEIDIVSLDVGSDLEYEKAPLLEGTAEDGGRLALAVIHDNAVSRAEGDETYGAYDLFVREKLDDRFEDELRGALRHGILEARISAQGFEPDEINALTKIGRVRSTTVSKEGERKTNQAFNLLLPMAFMALMLMSVMISGQSLMTTTIEEKSSRVVEVLLSAVSPMQLMTGKVVGQFAVGMTIMLIYAGIGIVALISFSMMGLIDPWLFFYAIIFFIIAYFVIASLLAAVGAAVNEIREAQTLMTPVMLVIMVPWMLAMPISRNPNSLFSTISSMVPPINTFVMMLRMTSTTPPPMWQVWLSIAIGIASVFGALWLAAKVFRIGILMHGKAPDFKTLFKWVRMA